MHVQLKMGNSDGRKYKHLKMEHMTWLSLLVALITLVTPASCSSPRVVCYYTNWSVYRPGTAKFNPQNINPYLCTHLVYAFGGFTKDNTLKPFDKYQDIEKGGYAKFNGLKTYNKNLKTILAIGGWNEGSSRFSPMVAAKDRRREFVRNVIKFLRQNHFDGLDLDWEYPSFRDGGKPKDRENYAKLVKELREEFEKESEKTGKPRLLLTMAVPAGIEYIEKGFDVKTLNRYLDWMNLLTYDYHSAFEPAVNHHAPLYPLEEPNEYSVDNELNIDYTIKYYLENGADRDKLVLGIPTYGRSYTLFNADAVEIGSPADGPGEQGDATREKGYLAYYEICEGLKPKSKKRAIASDEYSEEEDEEVEDSEEEEEEEWTVMYPNRNAMGPVAYRGNQWVGYDDVDIVRKKAEYVAENGLGGIMFWSIDNDDFRGTCHGKPYPLIEAAKEAYISKLGSTDITKFKDIPKVSTKSGNRRRNRPKNSSTTTTTTTKKPKTKSNKRKSSSTTAASVTPSWNIITPEPPTTPDPGTDFKCKEEGFFPHPRDCKKYFWCLDSGPSDLGIVAHHFTCPSGLYFNKAADSCDFARNVLCKKPAATTKAPTKATTAKTTVSTTTTTTTTTRRPIRLTSRSSLLFRTSSTSTTTPAPEPEVVEEESEEEDEASDVEAEDPKVIKELIDLIKKVGGVEQLEKHLKLSESSAGTTDGVASTTPSVFNKKLYQRVIERARGQNKFGGVNSITDYTVQNSRGGPQNAGLEPAPDKDRLQKKERPQYTTINRSRPSTTSTTEQSIDSEEAEEESEEVQQLTRFRQEPVVTVGTTPKTLQYVNIRRSRPSTAATTETPDDSRNALFERVEPYVAVEESPNSLDIASSRRENVPEYVTIRRARPTAETTTTQYQVFEKEESQDTVLEREITSQSSQPLYTSVLRTRSTTLPPPEEPNTPEPTTILSVQISSLLNAPNTDETESLQSEQTQTTVTQSNEVPEPETTTSSTAAITTPSPTTTSTTSAPSSTPTRRTLLRRRGSTTVTSTTAAPVSSTQAGRERRPFLRRTKATAAPDTAVGDATTPTADTNTNKFARRGNNRFKPQKTEEKPRESDAEKPSLNGVAARSDRPRNFVRRRPGGANATSTTVKPTPASALRRGPFRVANRRRPFFSSTTTTTTTAQPTTALLESDESLQDIGDTDAIEDPSLKQSTTQRPTTNVQRRRPLVQLKNEDQNPAATNEEEKKRQSKKYSSSFKQNQLDEILRLKSSAEEIDVTTEGKSTVEDISAETAVALAARQLLEAPVPIIPDYDDEPKSTRRPAQTIVDYKFTSPEYTEDYSKTQLYTEDYTRTPTYTTRHSFTETPTGTYASLQTDDVPTSTRSSLDTDTRLPAFTTTRAYTSRFSRPTIDAYDTNPTIPGVTLSLGSDGSGESTARYTNFPTESNLPSYTISNYESRVSRPRFSTVNPTTDSSTFRESTTKYSTSTETDESPTYSTAFRSRGSINYESRVSRPGFSTANPTTGSSTFRESASKYTSTESNESTTYPTGFTSRESSNYESRATRPRISTVHPTTDLSTFRESTSSTEREESPTYPTGFTGRVSSNYESRVTRPRFSTVNPATESSTFRESTSSTEREESPTYPTGFTSRVSSNYESRVTRPGFSTVNPTTDLSTFRESTSSSEREESPIYPTGFTSRVSSNYESRVTRPGFSTVNPTSDSSTFRESTSKYTSTERDVSPTYSTGFTSRVSRPAGFSPNLVNIDEVFEKSTARFSPSEGPSTARYDASSDKIPAPLVFGYSTGGQGLREPSYFTREYLLESPVTKSYDDEYQYLSPKVTSPQPSSRKPVRRKFVNRRISTTQSLTSVLPQTTPKPRQTTKKPFEKIPVVEDSDQKESVQAPVQNVKKTLVDAIRRPIKKVKKTEGRKSAEQSGAVRPISDYDYYDDGQGKVIENLEEAKKVILHGTGYQVSIKAPPRTDDAPPRNFIVFFGNIECLDIGNFPHPTSCKKFISCARMESGAVRGWEYVCPKGLSFDPVGGICNWSAGLGCSENDA